MYPNAPLAMAAADGRSGDSEAAMELLASFWRDGYCLGTDCVQFLSWEFGSATSECLASSRDVCSIHTVTDKPLNLPVKQLSIRMGPHI